jgi:hypothetical protein
MNRIKAQAWRKHFLAKAGPNKATDPKQEREPSLADYLRGYSPREFWHDDPASDRQIQCLRRRGFDLPDDITKGQAHHLIGGPTPRQSALLRSRGIAVDGMSFGAAQAIISAIADDEGWAQRQA